MAICTLMILFACLRMMRIIMCRGCNHGQSVNSLSHKQKRLPLKATFSLFNKQYTLYYFTIFLPPITYIPRGKTDASVPMKRPSRV